ncbi:MAG TPA: efflux RND transporter periplasmic adaptor subunit [Terriglobia bacterium]|nr:efflux RND transporter periplasmic adaptor subunit [Terriglobia bacterium]
MRTYHKAFLTALAVNVVLAAGLFRLGWRVYHLPRAHSATSAASPVSQPATSAQGESAQGVFPTQTALSTIQLSPERLQSIGIRTGTVEFKEVQDDVRATGDVEVDEERLAYVQVRFPGWIQKVYADAVYRYVRRGQPLFTIYSPDVVTTEREYLLARQNHNELKGSSIPGVAAGAESLLAGAVERLKQWDIPQREIDQLERSGKVQHEIEVDSPATGYIIERNALPNLYVQPETKLYTIADLSTIWVYAQVFETDLGKVRAGEPASVTVDAYPGLSLAGHVDQVLPQLDTTTRTARVRFVFSNSALKLMPGMFVNVDFKVPLGRQLVVPASAVLQSGTRQIVFVDRGGGYLEPREVELGSRAGDEFIVSKGLKANEPIVTSANFLIDSESQLQAALGSFVPPPPGAGEAASKQAGGNALDIEIATSPSPPRKGADTVRVALTQSGIPVTGAAVSVRFLMPAMPAMGMAARRIDVTLSDQGGGRYEGQVTLESGGSWQVSIVAQKEGRTIAAKQTTLNAEGGM